MDRVLVTGGAGFLGSHIADALIEQGYHVVIVDDLSGGFRRNIPAAAEFHHCSTNDRERIDALFRRHRFRTVVHCAAYAAEGLSHHLRHFIYSNNVVGSIPLINASVVHGVERFIFISSIAVYGDGVPPFTEEQVPAPVDPYGIAKLMIEQDLKAAQQYFGLPYTIFRPHNIYGERQNLADPYRNVVGIFLRHIMEGRPCPVFGDGSQRRAFSYVKDVAGCIAGSVESPAAVNAVFNIGSDEVYPVLELAALVQRSMGSNTGIEFLEQRNEVHTAFCDHQRVKELLHYRDATPLSEGIGRMAAWTRSIHPVPAPVLPVIEVMKRLPRSWRPVSPLHPTIKEMES